jgi:hypothetical protein
MAGAIGLLCMLAVRDASASACPPTAIVEGSSAIAASVRAILRGHGVAVDPGRCVDGLGVRASLLGQPGSRSYRLHIEDPFGRTSDRHVSDAETAASLIESWTLPAEDDHTSSPPRSSATRQATVEVVPSSVRGPPVQWRLAGALEVAAGSDNSLWYGGALTACGPIAALCVGGRVRFAHDDSVLGPDRDITRSATEFLVLAALPFARRNVTVTPMLGLGGGWTRTSAPRPEPDVVTAPSDDLSMRVEAAVGAGLALTPRVSLVGELSASRGWSMASAVRADGRGPVVNVPSGYLRAAFACQYSP